MNITLRNVNAWYDKDNPHKSLAIGGHFLFPVKPMPANIYRLDEARYRHLRRKASAKRRTVNNGQRLKMEAADRVRRETRDAELDAILAADAEALEAELERWTY
jgi:hypothetical protein